MRIAITHNLRLRESIEEAEFDTPETVQAIVETLASAGHDVEPIEVSGPASRLVARLEAYGPDLIFNTAEGKRGRMRRGFYPALFEQLGIPCTGPDAYTLCVTLDKALTKKILAGYGVQSPRGRLLTRETLAMGGLDDLTFPAIVKPNYEGSSKGISQQSVVEDALELAIVLDDLLALYPDGVLVERFIPGIDVAACFLEDLANRGSSAITPVEYVVDPGFLRRYDLLDYELKYRGRQHLALRVPPNLPPPALDRIRWIGERAIVALGLRDAAKIDLRIATDGSVHCLSVTALPSFDPKGAIVAAASSHRLEYADTVLSVLRTAAKRAGLLAMLDTPKTRARAKNGAPLKVGLAFNMKRISSDDSEAEYDAPKTIEAITKAIEGYGHHVVPLEATGDFPRALMTSGVDLVFNIAEGIRGRNREAQVPSLCELLGIPYTGSDSATLSLCLDKGLCKRLLRAQGIDTPAFQVLVTGREKLRAFRYPVIVKPNAEGTSKGITAASVVDDEAGVRAAARELIERYSQPALVEEYVFGREFTVGLLGERKTRVLPPMEVVFLETSARPVYDYVCKQDWESHVRYECPARLLPQEEKAIAQAARATFTALGCRDVARVDLRLAPDGRVWVIEINPLPGLTPDYSDLCLIGKGSGMDYRTLIGEILSSGIRRHRELREHPRAKVPIDKPMAPARAVLRP